MMAPRSGLLAGASLALLLSAVFPGGCNQSGMPGVGWWSASDRADAEFDASADRPPTVKTLYALTKVLLAEGKDRQAEAVLLRILQEHPKFTPAYSELAELLVQEERLDEGMRVLSKGLQVAPRDPILLNNAGMCRIFRGDYVVALDLFTRAAAVDPENARYRANMAVALGMMGRYEECLALYEQVLPPDEAHYNLAVLCKARHDTVRAEEEFDHADKLRAAATESGEKAEPSGKEPEGTED